MHMRRGAGGLVFEGNVQGENGGVNVMATSSGVFSTVRAINELVRLLNSRDYEGRAPSILLSSSRLTWVRLPAESGLGISTGQDPISLPE